MKSTNLKNPVDHFKCRALTALAISIGADLLDFIAAPIFDTPVLGDAFDAVTVALLYRITKSKLSAAINLLEFVPVIGDLFPVYTLSTLLWIIRSSAGQYVNIPGVVDVITQRVSSFIPNVRPRFLQGRTYTSDEG